MKMTDLVEKYMNGLDTKGKVQFTLESSRMFHFNFDVDYITKNVEELMESGLSYDDAENIAFYKAIINFAADFQEMHLGLIEKEDYPDADAELLETIEHINSYTIYADSSLSEVRDVFNGEIFGDQPISIYTEEVEETEEEAVAAGGAN